LSRFLGKSSTATDVAVFVLRTFVYREIYAMTTRTCRLDDGRILPYDGLIAEMHRSREELRRFRKSMSASYREVGHGIIWEIDGVRQLGKTVGYFYVNPHRPTV